MIRAIWSRFARGNPEQRLGARLLADIEALIGPQPIARVREALALQHPRDQFDQVPPATLAIVFASRAGSSFAGRLLENTPFFEAVNESFQPVQLDLVREREDLATAGAAAEWMVAQRGTAYAFAFKAGFNCLIGAILTGYLAPAFANTSFLHLKRRDQVAQAVSLTKADMSGQYSSNDKPARSVTIDDYDGMAIARNLERIIRNNRLFEQLLKRWDRPSDTVYYEDICARPQEFVRKACGSLSLALDQEPETTNDLQIMRDGINEAWISRFREDSSVAEVNSAG